MSAGPTFDSHRVPGNQRPFDFGDHAFRPPTEDGQILIWDYAEPWCACGVRAGSTIFIHRIQCTVKRSFIGPIEHPRALADEILKRWATPVSLGTIEGPFVVALQVTPSDGVPVIMQCPGHWRLSVGWQEALFYSLSSSKESTSSPG